MFPPNKCISTTELKGRSFGRCYSLLSPPLTSYLPRKMLAVVNWYVRCRREINSFVHDAAILSGKTGTNELKRTTSAPSRRPSAVKTAGLTSLEQELRTLLMDASCKTTPHPKQDNLDATPRTIPRDSETPRCLPTHFNTPTTKAKDLMTKSVTELTNDEVAIVLLAKFSR
jgi:hypothetical protein